MPKRCTGARRGGQRAGRQRLEPRAHQRRQANGLGLHVHHAAARHGVPLAVGFNRRFDPSFASLATRLAAGEVGTLESVSIVSRDPQPPPAGYIASSGGLFRDMMIHDLDVILSFVKSKVRSVKAIGHPVLTTSIDMAGKCLPKTRR